MSHPCPYASGECKEKTSGKVLVSCRIVDNCVGFRNAFPLEVCSACRVETNSFPVDPAYGRSKTVDDMVKVLSLHPLSLAFDDVTVKKVFGRAREEYIDAARSLDVSDDSIASALLRSIDRGRGVEGVTAVNR